ncbi:MAG: ImmA/IrrE family metallo-endopeptidase [Rhodothermaceae bacterium]|nr:ImmA/IrrE family metallo-endopeptidase [Rhodothermaceae bacterium]MYK17362.1 ImmA/IrrE family metallo-endopeptidase [Candidatus Poribacteria bacterium]
MPTVNPEILVWARKTAGLAPDEAARKIRLRDSRDMTAVDKLIAMERGDKDPTRANLVQMAQQYRRPLLAFYLAQPPPTITRGVDFRTISGIQSDRMSHLIDALIREVRSRQSMVRAVLEAEDEVYSLPFVGILRDLKGVSACTDQAVSYAVEALYQVLGLDLPTEYYEESGPKAAFDLLRSKVEAAGVFVLLKGNLGSYHTDIPADVFRGFVIADEIAPFVVINNLDSPSAWSFTLLHEMVHLLLNETGISGHGSEMESEVFCNTVASTCLLPTEDLEQVGIKPNQDIIEQEQLISSFAQQRNLSHTMVAYRLLRSGSIDQLTFEDLRKRFAQRWEHNRRKQRERSRKSRGGPSYYVVHRYRVGPALLSLTGRMMGSGALSTTKAAKILDVKPTNVGSMIAPFMNP